MFTGSKWSCDRCGSERDNAPSENISLMEDFNGKVWGHTQEHYYELCCVCVAALREWLRSGVKVPQKPTDTDRKISRVMRLILNDGDFGCGGRHHGVGTKECPKALHHHHDDFCQQPTIDELRLAGISYETYQERRRERRK